MDDPDLHGSTVVSAGLGEDASFDVEFARKYDAKVVIVDPTPRAIVHFNEIATRLGIGNSRDYVRGGKQPVDAYDLRGLTTANLTLVPKALWDSDTTLKFFEPPNPEHVSHSIVDFHHSYKKNTKHIEVEATTVPRLLEEIGLSGKMLQLIKLDIEGAEVEVISHLLEGGVRPNQILVEFDELNAPSERSFQRIDSANSELKGHGYKCIYTDGHTNFLYVPDGDKGKSSSS